MADYSYPRATWALPALVTDENWWDMSDDDIAGAFASLSDGHDPIASANLIRYFQFALQSGDLFGTCAKLGAKERVFLDFIEHAFGRYSDGKSLDAAFGLIRTKGQRNIPDHRMRNLGIAAKVVLGVRTEMENRNIYASDVKLEPIYREAALGSGIGWKSVEKIYRDEGEELHLFPNSVLGLLAEHLTKSPPFDSRDIDGLPHSPVENRQP